MEAVVVGLDGVVGQPVASVDAVALLEHVQLAADFLLKHVDVEEARELLEALSSASSGGGYVRVSGHRSKILTRLPRAAASNVTPASFEALTKARITATSRSCRMERLSARRLA